MRRAAVFVLSDVRSGSTLLDQCLGAHTQIVSLGEVHWLRAYLLQDRRLYDPAHPLACSCGRPISECPFWLEVTDKLGRPLSELQLHSRFSTVSDGRGRSSLVRRLPLRLLRQAPALFRFRFARAIADGPRMARDSIDLYDAVEAVTGCAYSVDSSKSPLRFRSVYALQPEKTVAIVLSRDYRAVVHSKIKRGAKFEVAAKGWRRRMHEIDVLTRDLPRSRLHYLKYEDLCANPHAALARLCEFLGVEFQDEMLQRPDRNLHHIGGSPSKFDASRIRIELDRSFVDFFKADEVERLRKLVGEEATRWGY